MLMAVSNAPIVAMAREAVGNVAAHAAMTGFDAVTETFDCVDFFSFKAMTAPAKTKGKKGIDPDFPTFHQAMRSPDSEEWKAVMDMEIETLEGLGTWTLVPRSEAAAQGKKVIKSTWAFCQKRTPDGLPTKKKARFCV